jgi:hypothetical protein
MAAIAPVIDSVLGESSPSFSRAIPFQQVFLMSHPLRWNAKLRIYSLDYWGSRRQKGKPELEDGAPSLRRGHARVRSYDLYPFDPEQAISGSIDFINRILPGSYAWVAPLGRQVGRFRQIYSSDSNENTRIRTFGLNGISDSVI